MKKIILISHCVLNSYCELPKAPDDLRKEILEHLVNQDVSILQLPCPEFSYQGLNRESIHPGDERFEAYQRHCVNILGPIIKDLKEYIANGISLVGIIGVETSPSCSVEDKDAIMMRILLEQLEKLDINLPGVVNMPVKIEDARDKFLLSLQSICK